MVKMILVGWLLLLHCLPGCLAKYKTSERKTKWDDIAVNACSMELESYAYKTDARGRHASICTYEPAFASWLHCVKATLQDRKQDNSLFERSFDIINRLCQDYHKDGPISKEDFYKSFENATSLIRPVGSSTEVILNPIIPDQASLDRWIWAFLGPLENIDNGTFFGGIINMYWICALCIAATYKLLKFSRVKRVIFRNRVSAVLRGRVIIPAALHNHALAIGRWIFVGLVPTRLEAAVLAGYFLLHTIFLTSYHVDPHNLLGNSKSQFVVFFSDRAGILAFAHFPLIVLFGGRNNLLNRITGIRSTSFITFHKWLGRIMFIDCSIHALGYTYHAYLQNYWKYVKRSLIWTVGRHAVYFLAAAIFLSFFFFRSRYYEFFLITHILLALGFFYACWRHCYTLGWTEWIILAMLIWISDRLLRVIRIIIFGLPLARLELCNGESIIKVTIPKSARIWKAEPGQYIYLHFLKAKFFWQSHPFTVMDSLIDEERLVVVIAVKSGITDALRTYLLQSEENEMRVAVEGPYGESTCTKPFESVLCLAGGAGIPGPLSIAMAAAREETLKDQHITFVWSLRDLNLLDLYNKELSLLKDLGVDLQIFFTGDYNRELPMEEEESVRQKMKNKETLLVSSDSSLSITEFNRPNIDGLLEESIACAESVLVVSCGSPGFVDKTRELTAKKIVEKSDKFIEYVEDFQTW